MTRSSVRRAAPLCVALALAGAPPSIQAQTLTLQAAADSALASHPSVGAADARLDAADAGRAGARAALFPALSANGTLMRFEEPMVVAPLHGFDPMNPPTFDRTLVQGQLGLDWTLWDGGARGARIRGAEATEGVATSRKEATTMELLENVVTAYTGVLGTRELQAAASRQVDALEAERQRADQRLQEGTAARVDVLRAEAALLDARAQKATADARVGLAERNLARLMGVPAEAVAGRVLADVSPRPGLPHTTVKDPRIMAARRGVDAARARLDAQRAGRLPRLQASRGLQDYGSAAGKLRHRVAGRSEDQLAALHRWREGGRHAVGGGGLRAEEDLAQTQLAVAGRWTRPTQRCRSPAGAPKRSRLRWPSGRRWPASRICRSRPAPACRRTSCAPRPPSTARRRGTPGRATTSFSHTYGWPGPRGPGPGMDGRSAGDRTMKKRTEIIVPVLALAALVDHVARPPQRERRPTRGCSPRAPWRPPKRTWASRCRAAWRRCSPRRETWCPAGRSSRCWTPRSWPPRATPPPPRWPPPRRASRRWCGAPAPRRSPRPRPPCARRDQRAANADRDAQRAQKLFDGGAVSQQALDKATTARDVADAARDQARDALTLVQEGPRAEIIRAQRALVSQAHANLDRAQAALANAVIRAPFPGVVTVRHREPGEIVSPGAPIVTLLNPDDRWVRIYVREDEIGRVHVGQKATITSDTYPDRTYHGRVTYIGSQAEFTPRNVQTQEERIKLVYPVKVRITGDTAFELKPGVPADVTLEESGS